MKDRTGYSLFVAAAIAAAVGVLLLISFSGSHTGCSLPLSASVPNGLRDCTRMNAFYCAGWVLMGIAMIVTAMGVLAPIQRGRQTASEPS